MKYIIPILILILFSCNHERTVNFNIKETVNNFQIKLDTVNTTLELKDKEVCINDTCYVNNELLCQSKCKNCIVTSILDGYECKLVVTNSEITSFHWIKPNVTLHYK